jgi:hypothetical protein
MKSKNTFKDLLLLLLLLNLSITSQAQGLSVSAKSAADQSDAKRPGSLAAVLAKVGKKPATIELIGSGEYKLKSGLTVPKNVTLRFDRGAVLSVPAGKELVINGGIEAGLQQIFSGEGIVNGAIQVPTIYPQWFGAAGDAVADDTLAVQKAIDLACRSRILSVDLNRGQYRITKTLNCTNTREPGTLMRDGLKIFGASFTGAALVGETGDGHAVIETSGAQWLTLKEFSINPGKNNKSTVGMFTGCPKILPQSQNQTYNLMIFMHDDPAANDGNGTIAVWNFAAEEHTYDRMYIHANRPVVLTAYNGANGFEYKNSYLELLPTHSLGVTTFTGECFLASINKRFPAVTTVDINSLNMQNTYIGVTFGNEGSSTCAFDVRGGLTGFTYSGTIEGFAGFAKINGAIVAGNVTATFGGVADPTAPVITFGENAQIVNSDMKFTFCAQPDRNLFKMEAPESKNTGIINSTIKTSQSPEWIVIPEKLKANSTTSTVMTSFGK